MAINLLSGSNPDVATVALTHSPCCSTDINECNIANGGCEHSCTNTIGYFICGCDTVHQLDGNGLSCSGEGLKIDKLYSHDRMSLVISVDIDDNFISSLQVRIALSGFLHHLAVVTITNSECWGKR